LYSVRQHLNHGKCSYCKNGRLFFDKKQRKPKDEELRNYLKEIDEFEKREIEACSIYEKFKKTGYTFEEVCLLYGGN
jgi:hypothetical protein